MKKKDSNVVNEYNFYSNTFAMFREVETPLSIPDHLSSCGSEYYHVEGGVIRTSDHWGLAVGSCDWFLEETIPHLVRKGIYRITLPYSMSGFCAWEDFLRIPPYKQKRYTTYTSTYPVEVHSIIEHSLRTNAIRSEHEDSPNFYRSQLESLYRAKSCTIIHATGHRNRTTTPLYTQLNPTTQEYKGVIKQLNPTICVLEDFSGTSVHIPYVNILGVYDGGYGKKRVK